MKIEENLSILYKLSIFRFIKQHVVNLNQVDISKLNPNFKKHNLKGQGVEKIIILYNLTDIYTRLEVLLGLKLSGHTDILTEAST